MSALAFVDTETTGLDPDTEEIFEVAIIRDDREHVFRLPPADSTVAQMHPKAAEVNRYHERTAAPGWRWDHDPHRSLLDISDLLDGAHMVGAVPDFDARFLTALYRRASHDVPRWHYHLIDIEAMAVGWLAGRRSMSKAGIPDLPLPWDSDDLSRACGVEPPSDDERHTALGDARWTRRWYEVVAA